MRAEFKAGVGGMLPPPRALQPLIRYGPVTSAGYVSNLRDQQLPSIGQSQAQPLFVERCVWLGAPSVPLHHPIYSPGGFTAAHGVLTFHNKPVPTTPYSPGARYYSTQCTPLLKWVWVWVRAGCGGRTRWRWRTTARGRLASPPRTR